MACALAGSHAQTRAHLVTCAVSGAHAPALTPGVSQEVQILGLDVSATACVDDPHPVVNR